MAEETTISMAGINAPPLYRLVEDGGKTVIVTADTNTPMWVINGDIAGGAKPMTTAERTAITPSEGELIYDTDLGAVYVGDGVTPGGVAIGSGGGGGGDYTFSNEFTVTAAGGVSINTISASKITGKVGSAGVADALINGATVGYAQSAGTAATATTATTAATATTASTANGVTQAVKDDIISSAGGGSLDGEIASVNEVMTGITGGTTAVVDVSGFRGALTAGQAVDVTSKPDDFDEHVAAGTYKATFLWPREYTLGFAAFPKFASGLKYLLIADVQATEDGATVTPGGTWLSGGSSAISLPNGVYTRIAMLFDSADSCTLTFSGTDPFVKKLREYEVTACSDEAIAYIAALTDPDAFQDYYLVKRDMVSPWTYIINMGDSPSTTVAAGLAYQINAMIGTHIITVDTCPTGYVGRDTFVRLLVGSSGTVVIQPPLYLASPLIANAINNCTISYRDGAAVLTVNDTVGGYVVDAASGTTAGTLYYGLTDSSTKFISIPGAFDGIPIATEGATVATSGTEQKFVVGNGIGNSLLSGNLNAGANKINLSNVSLADVGITGGTLTLTDGASVGGGTTIVSNGATLTFSGGSITSGGTATFVTGGSIKLASIGGDGSGTLDLNNTQYDITSGTSIRIRDINVIRGSGTAGGFILRANVDAAFVGVHFSNCTGTNNARGILSFGGNKTLIVSNCTFDGGTGGATAAGYIYIAGGTAEVTGCTCEGNSLNVGAAGVVKLLGGNTVNQCVVNGGTIAFIGSNAVPNGRVFNSGTVGKVVISAGATISLLGNAATNSAIIAPGGTGNVEYGANVKIINSAGTTVTLNSGNAGSCTQINKDGTIS